MTDTGQNEEETWHMFLSERLQVRTKDCVVDLVVHNDLRLPATDVEPNMVTLVWGTTGDHYAEVEIDRNTLEVSWFTKNRVDGNVLCGGPTEILDNTALSAIQRAGAK